MHERNNTTCFVLAIIACLYLSITSCSTDSITTKTLYEKANITNDSIREVIKPGDSVQIETKDLISRIKVTGYRDNKYIIGIDEFTGREIGIAYSDIREVRMLRIKPSSADQNQSGNKGAVVVESLGWLALGVASTYEKLVGNASTQERENEYARNWKIYSELKYLEYAKEALSDGNTEAAYRLLEDGLVSEFIEVRNKFKDYLDQHPEIYQGAIRSFTSESFKKSISKYGDAAREIQKRRLSIYKTVAPVHEYQNALNNYEGAFGPEK